MRSAAGKRSLLHLQCLWHAVASFQRLVPRPYRKPHVPTFRKPAPAVTTMPDCRPGQLVVEINPNADGDQIKKDLDEVGGKIVKTVADENYTVALVQVSSDDKKFLDAFKKMSKDKKNFNLVQENRIYRKCGWPKAVNPTIRIFSCSPSTSPTTSCSDKSGWPRKDLLCQSQIPRIRQEQPWSSDFSIPAASL